MSNGIPKMAGNSGTGMQQHYTQIDGSLNNFSGLKMPNGTEIPPIAGLLPILTALALTLYRRKISNKK